MRVQRLGFAAAARDGSRLMRLRRMSIFLSDADIRKPMLLRKSNTAGRYSTSTLCQGLFEPLRGDEIKKWKESPVTSASHVYRG
jgi:hypothetical protein